MHCNCNNHLEPLDSCCTCTKVDSTYHTAKIIVTTFATLHKKGTHYSVFNNTVEIFGWWTWIFNSSTKKQVMIHLFGAFPPMLQMWTLWFFSRMINGTIFKSAASVSLWEPLCSTPLFSANSVFVYFTENDSPVSYVTKVGLTWIQSDFHTKRKIKVLRIFVKYWEFSYFRRVTTL